MFSIQFAVESEEKIVRGIRSCRNRAYSSPSQEETVTPKSSKHSNQYAGVSFKTIDFMTLKILVMHLM